MVRNYKRKLGRVPNCNYTEENLQLALAEIRKKTLSQRKASEKYGIPRSTLKRKLDNSHPRKYGRQPVFSINEETQLVDGLLLCASWGFPLTKLDIRILVKQFLDRTGRNEPRFVNNTPGKDFLKYFFKRHPNITVRFGENIKRARAAVDADKINNYFNELETSLTDVSPNSLINYDETNFCDDPGKQRVIVKRGSKHPENVLDSSKTSVSVMMAGTASGFLLPPYIVYRAENIYPTWIEGGPVGTRYNRSKSGWFDENIFENWFETLALPYLKKQPAPRALVGDNLSSHVSLNVIEQCRVNDVRFILLPPNATHMCQPLDVAFFGPLKKKWRSVLFEWKKKNRGVLPKSEFPRVLRQTLESLERSSENLIAGFVATGLYPVNRQKILDKLPKNDDQPQETLNIWNPELLNFLEKTRSPANVEKKQGAKKLMF